MGALIRAMDWSLTPVGPIQNWSPSLRMMVDLLLANRFPLLLWWGADYISIYNDAYRPVLGAKHPWALGTPVRECWSEIWDVLKPLIDTPFKGGPATWMDDLPLEINRHGFLEETHFTVAYSPVPDDTAPNRIGGVLATVHEITEKIIGERRIAALRDLSAGTSEAKSANDACTLAARALAGYPRDVPFALIYLLDETGQRARLASTTGIEEGAPLAPATIELAPSSEGDSTWPLAKAVRREAAVLVEDLPLRFREIPAGPWSDPPHAALIVPIKANMAHQLAGFLIAGTSSRLMLDDQYRSFFDLAAGQIATAIATARAYEEERRRAEALAEIDRAKTLFFSNVSHEFRTPLTLMLGPLEGALSSESLLPAERQRLDVAHRNSLRLLKLVNSLLDFSRIEAGRVQAIYEPVDLAQLTAELASNFRSVCDKAGLNLLVDCPPLAGQVYADRDMWEKIVLNLLSNAFKFTFDGEIAIRLREEDGHAILEVHDSGVGIPARELPRLFERFHRVEGQKSRTFEGSGIGLALVQELVKLHGGTISVESQVDRGTTFRVSILCGHAHLPAERIGAGRSPSIAIRADAYVQEALRWLPDGAPFVENPREIDAPSDMGRLKDRARILVADDNSDMRDYLRRLLEGLCEVEAVAEGEAALQAIRARRPDLVIADVMMPRLDGFGLVRAIRDDPELLELPIIMLSARAGEESRVKGLQSGADDYLVKPFSARELIARVSAHLGLSRVRREVAEGLRRRQAWLAGEAQAFQATMNGAPLERCLDILIRTIVQQADDGRRCAFYIANPDGTELHHVVGMTEIYAREVDGLKIGPDSFACGLAAHEGQPVITRDVTLEPRWRPWLWLAREYGYRACWSFPVETSAGRIVGTFAIYHKEPREPTPLDFELATALAQTASIIISRFQETTERARMGDHLLESEKKLASELQATRHLQAISTHLIHERDTKAFYGKIIDAAVSITHSDFASIQMLYPERGTQGELRLLASRGFSSEATKFWEWVRADSGCTCGEALRTGKRAIASNVETCEFMAGTADRTAYLQAGILAAQSTPLISRSGRVLGMISTHWRQPYEPSESAFQRLDVLARQAADLMERAESEQKLQESEAQLRLAIEAGDVGLWDVDPVNDKLYWPARVKTMFGISPDVPVSMADFYAGLHPADREATSAAFAAALDPEKRALYDVEYRTIGAEDRIVRWVAARGRGIFDADGTCVRVIGTAIDITTRKLHEERQKLLLAELNHRVKNTLATVQSFAMQTLRNASSLTEAHAAFDARLIALSKAHDVLVREHWEGAGLHEVVSGALAPYSGSHQTSRVTFAGPEIRLQPKAALALSMALHELATNAVKYGALSNGAGDVAVSWHVDPRDGQFQLRWREAGGPPVVAPRRRGFGSRLIEQGLSQDLAGEVDLRFNADGVACTIQTSLDEIRGKGIRIPGPYEENAFKEA